MEKASPEKGVQNKKAVPSNAIPAVKKQPSVQQLNKTKQLKQATTEAQKKAAETQKQRKEAADSKPLTMSSILGDVCWLLSQSLAHRYSFFLADIEWMVLPAIVNGQYKLFQSDNRPVGVALWASVSDEVQKRLEKGGGRLAVQEWNSGKNTWLIDVISPFGQAEQMLEDLKKTVFKGKSFKYHRTTPKGGREVVTVQPE